MLLLHLFHYSASFLLFPCLRLALSLQISCFLSVSAIPVFSRALLQSFPLLLLLVLSLPICHSLSIPPSPPSLKETIPPPASLPLQARPWSGIRNPSSLLDRELRRLGFGTSALLTAGTENRCHFRCQLQADEQQLPEGTDLLHGSCWADTECRLLAGVKLQAEPSC